MPKDAAPLKLEYHHQHAKLFSQSQMKIKLIILYLMFRFKVILHGILNSKKIINILQGKIFKFRNPKNRKVYIN